MLAKGIVAMTDASANIIPLWRPPCGLGVA